MKQIKIKDIKVGDYICAKDTRARARLYKNLNEIWDKTYFQVKKIENEDRIELFSDKWIDYKLDGSWGIDYNSICITTRHIRFYKLTDREFLVLSL